MGIENSFASSPEAHQNKYLEVIAKEFSQEFEVEKDLSPQDYLALVFSNILSKKVYLAGQSRVEESIYLMTSAGQIEELPIRRDETTDKNNTESFGGEPIADALMEVPIEKEILYFIKKTDFYKGEEGNLPQFISPRAKAEMEKNIPAAPSNDIIEVYEFDKEKMYKYLKDHATDEYVQDVLSRSANPAKFKWWLSEY